MMVVTHDDPKELKENFKKRIDSIKEESKEYYLKLYGNPIIFLSVNFLLRLERAIEEFLGDMAREIIYSLGILRGQESAEKLIEVIGIREYSSLALEEKLKYALNMLFLNGVGSLSLELSEDCNVIKLKTNKTNAAIYKDGRIVSYVLGYATGFLSKILEKKLDVSNVREVNDLIIIDYKVVENGF